MKRQVAQMASSFLAVVAVLFATPMSAFYIHKPEVPAELKK